MTDDQRSPEEKQTAMLATALISKRADGRIEEPSPQMAGQLLGCIGSYSTGLGNFNLLIPANKIHDLGLNQELWDMAAPRVTLEGKSMHNLDYLTGVDMIGRLEYVSGMSWDKATQLRGAVDASKSDKGVV